MAIGTPLVAVGATTTGTTSAQPVTMPAGAAVGDLAVCVGNVGAGTGITMTGPAGWTQLVNQTVSVSTGKLGVWVKELVSGDLGGTVTVTPSAARGMVVALLVLPGADYSSISTVNAQAGATSVTIPSATPAVDDAILIGITSGAATVTNSARSFTPPSGWTELVDRFTTSSSARPGIGVFTKQLTGGSGVASGTATIAASGTFDALTLNLIAVPAATSQNESGGASVTTSTTTAGAGTASETASGGADAPVAASTAGAGTATETAAGGTSSTTTATAAGAGTAVEAQAGGAAASATSSVTGAGTAAESASGGSLVTVAAASAGQGTAREAAAGGSSAAVTVTATGGGASVQLQHESGGAPAGVATAAAGAGPAQETASGGTSTTITSTTTTSTTGAGTAHEAASGGFPAWVGAVAGGDGAAVELATGGSPVGVLVEVTGGGEQGDPPRDVTVLSIREVPRPFSATDRSRDVTVTDRQRVVTIRLIP